MVGCDALEDMGSKPGTHGMSQERKLDFDLLVQTVNIGREDMNLVLAD